MSDFQPGIAAVQKLTVKYGRKTILDDFDLVIPEGCVGLLGPNGAGKTTLLKTLLGFVRPHSGQGHVLGMDVWTQGLRIRQAIGLMPEQDCHIPGMNAVTFVAYAGELAGMPADQAMRRAHEVLEYCGLGEARYRNVETYSTGMKQRIKLAQALVHGPKLLFLDEPTNGLDPEGRDQMLTLIRDVSHGKGLSVVVCSHLLPDIERTCDHAIVLLKGKLVCAGPIDALRSTTSATIDIELIAPSTAFTDAIGHLGGTVAEVRGNTLRVGFDDNATEIGHKIFTAAIQSGVQVRGFIPAQRSLEDVFLEAIDQ